MKDEATDCGTSAVTMGYAAMERPTMFERAMDEIERAYRDEYTRTGKEPEGIVISADIYLSMPMGSDAGGLKWKDIPVMVDGLLDGFAARAYSDPADWIAAAGPA